MIRTRYKMTVSHFRSAKRKMLRRQLRRCTATAKYLEELTVHERTLRRELLKKHDPQIKKDIASKLRDLNMERTKFYMYPGMDTSIGKIEDNEFAPTTLSLEEAEEAGVRDINADAATYQVAVDTLRERGMDVASLFQAVGCPEPVVVLLHLITLHKSGNLELTDRHVATVIGRHADEMKSNKETGKDDVKKAFKMRDACLDSEVPFEREAHTALLRSACLGRDLDAACEVFQELVTFGEERHYGMVMTAAIQAGETGFALELFDEMKQRKVLITEKSVLLAVSAFAAVGDFKAAERLQQDYEGMGNIATTAMQRELLRAYCNAGDMEGALKMDAAIGHGTIDDSERYSALIHGAGVAGDLGAGIALVERAFQAGVLRLDGIHSLLEATAREGLVKEAFSLVNLIMRLKLKSIPETGDLLVSSIINSPQVSSHDIHEAWTWLTTQHWTPTSQAVSLIVEVSACQGHANAQQYLDTARRRDIAVDNSCLTTIMLRQAKAKIPLKMPLEIFKSLKSKTKEAWYALSEVLCSTTDYAIALRLAQEVYPDMEHKVVGKGMLRGSSCTTLPQLSHYVRGLGKIHVLSDLELLRTHTEQITDCCKVFIPFCLLAEEILKNGADTDIYEMMALPHVEVIRVTEQLLAHAAVDALNLIHLFDFTMKSHRFIAFTSLLAKVGQPFRCKVVLLGHSGPEHNQSSLASEVGVDIVRI
eukprot:TRINITY_DN24114_c0_g1_i1.p1 TRINITY_DN24114_c0_g1~~TRINITY_DN24114_c0_g1_i1.p1  ORF type:complete len:706 (+),score=147.41 TRINITY_DN24114_c0_g1_i1:1090-3207(+)